MDKNSLKRTNERCYICDFSKPVNEKGFTADVGHIKGVDSTYSDSLAGESYEGRYVFIHPKDGKPICNVCDKSTIIALADFTAGEPVTWHDTNARLFEKTTYNVPADLYNPNIDWSNLELNENGTFKFPLKLKHQPEQIGWGLCEKVDILALEGRKLPGYPSTTQPQDASVASNLGQIGHV